MRKIYILLACAFVMSSESCIADDLSKPRVATISPTQTKTSEEGITVVFTEQEIQALVDLLNDGVKFAGLSKAQAAGYLYDKMQKAVATSKKAP